MKFLWGDLLAGDDPYYSPHLSLNHHGLPLRHIPDTTDELRNRVTVRWSGIPRADGHVDR